MIVFKKEWLLTEDEIVSFFERACRATEGEGTTEFPELSIGMVGRLCSIARRSIQNPLDEQARRNRTFVEAMDAIDDFVAVTGIALEDGPKLGMKMARKLVREQMDKPMPSFRDKS